MQNMKDTVEVLGFLDGGDVCRLFDHADQALIPCSTGAVSTRIDVGDVVANRAEPEVGFDVAHRLGKPFGVIVAGAEDVEGKALRALGANAGELFQFIDQARHGFGKLGHESSIVILG